MSEQGNLCERLFERIPVGIYRTTPAGEIIEVNSALVSMLGYEKPEELLNRDLNAEGFDPVHPRATFRKKIERDDRVIAHETIWLRRDGTRIYVRESAHAVRDAEGQTVYYEGIVEDVTPARTQVAAQLAKLTTREREILLLLSEGNGNKQIAAELSLSTRTVEAHRSNMMKKLNLDSFAQLVRLGIALSGMQAQSHSSP